MNLFANLIYLNIGILFVCAQNDGKYRPTSSFVTNKPLVINDGRYRPSNDGRYYPDNGGKYRPVNDGKYVHVADKDRGQYTGGGGQYTGGGGQYTGGGGQYTGGGGQYTGGGGQYTGGAGQYTGGGGQYTGRGNNGVQQSGNGGDRKNIVGSEKINAGNGVQQVRTTVKPIPNPNLNTGNLNTGAKDGWATIRDERTEDIDGYHYIYETENGILADEQGRIESLTPDKNGLRSKGFYQYTGDDGVLYRVDYVADHNGFVAQGAHIPKTPPAIQKLLDDIASQS